MAVRRGKRRRAARQRRQAKAPNATGKPGAPTARAREARAQPPTTADERFPIVGMGASAGGIEALQAFFERMPPDSGMGFVVVQHLASKRDSMLAEILSHRTQMPVQEAAEGMPVRPDHVYVIPPDALLSIRAGVLHLAPIPDTSGIRMSIDRFFASLAEDQGDNAVCIVLSGSGTDGTLGLRAVKERSEEHMSELQSHSFISYA